MPKGSNAKKGVKGFQRSSTPPPPQPAPPPPPLSTRSEDEPSKPQPSSAAAEALSEEDLHLWWLLQHGQMEHPDVKADDIVVTSSHSSTIRISSPFDINKSRKYLSKVRAFAEAAGMNTDQVNIFLGRLNENSTTEYRMMEDGSFVATSANGPDITYANDEYLTPTVNYYMGGSRPRPSRASSPPAAQTGTGSAPTPEPSPPTVEEPSAIPNGRSGKKKFWGRWR